jgi:hypothetical protein
VDVDEDGESHDIVDEEFRPAQPFRSKRSMSISSTPANAPTPLSQSHTASDLGMVPKLTSASQTNLSIRSGRSGKSSKSRNGRSRRNTERSIEVPTSPSSRTSFDKAFSFVSSRRSDPEPQTREERIRAARRKFEEREANKDRKIEREALKRRESEEAKTFKRQERQRRKSEASEQPHPPRPVQGPGRDGPKIKKGGRKHEDDTNDMTFHSRSYEDSRPCFVLPRQGGEAGMSEKSPPRAQERKSSHSAQSGWVRFSAWFQTRMLHCAGSRR